MTLSITKKLDALRMSFEKFKIQGFINPTSDPHLSEYTASHWKFREWISGFTGSAGTIVILKNKAALWTDSRYFIQATDQLADTGIELMKEKLPDTPTIEQYISSAFQSSNKAHNSYIYIGIDNTLFSASQVEKMEKEFADRGIRLIYCPEIVNEVWSDRPELPQSKVYIYPLQYAGVSSKNKIELIRKKYQSSHAQGILLSALDEIAWTLNIRGNDIYDNPVVVSFLLITDEDIRWYVSPEKIDSEVKTYLDKIGVNILPYGSVYQDIADKKLSNVQIDFDKSNDALVRGLEDRAINGKSPVALLKAVRNEIEMQGIHAAMQRDGVAMVRFIKWLKDNVNSGKLTELSVDKKLHDFRASQPLFKDESFSTIAGYGQHAAIVHYEATPETDVVIEPQGLLLVDSGAQYLDGTTDITRTIAMGPLSETEKHDYTLILKGHIQLAMSVFPAGTTGGQLDAFARMPIWREHKNYLHGTGHGVGHFLSVHEGPQSIRMEQNNVVLMPGMITSNEPGLYIEGSHGIRTENLTLVIEDGKGMFGQYYRFETITLCPIDKEPIIRKMLSAEEISWLNEYHARVYNLLQPDLNEDERKWLQEATSAI